MSYSKHGNKKLAAILVIFVLLFLSLYFPTLSKSEKLRDHFSVWCDDPDVTNPLPVALVYARENGICFDGVLLFSTLKDFLEREYAAPVVIVKGSPLYHVEYDSGFYDQFSENVSFYEPTEDGFVIMGNDNGEPLELADLQPGDYLMEITIYVEKGDEYYAGASFLHIIVPGGKRMVWPLKTYALILETPTLTPEPTFTP